MPQRYGAVPTGGATPAKIASLPVEASGIYGMTTLSNGQTMSPRSSPASNSVLDALTSADRALVEPNLQPCVLTAGQVLFEAGTPITSVYLPVLGQISLRIAAEDGTEVESASISNEGIVGLGGLLARDVSFTRQKVQISGRAFVVPRNLFLTSVQSSPSLRRVLSVHHDAFAAHMLQSVFCQARHRANQRIARWLLAAFDAVIDDPLPLTQEIVAAALGVRRPTVTISLQWMASSGLIELGRGRIKLIDRAGLERQACPCYAIIRGGYDKIRSLN